MALLVAPLLVAHARGLVFRALDGHFLCLMLRRRDLAVQEVCHGACLSMGVRGRRGGIVLLMPWLLDGVGGDAADCRCLNNFYCEYSEDGRLRSNVQCLLYH